MRDDLSLIPLDLGRGRQRLRPFEPDDRLLGLLVGEVELDGAAHGEDRADASAAFISTAVWNRAVR